MESKIEFKVFQVHFNLYISSTFLLFEEKKKMGTRRKKENFSIEIVHKLWLAIKLD